MTRLLEVSEKGLAQSKSVEHLSTAKHVVLVLRERYVYMYAYVCMYVM